MPIVFLLPSLNLTYNRYPKKHVIYSERAHTHPVCHNNRNTGNHSHRRISVAPPEMRLAIGGNVQLFKYQLLLSWLRVRGTWPSGQADFVLHEVRTRFCSVLGAPGVATEKLAEWDINDGGWLPQLRGFNWRSMIIISPLRCRSRREY